MTLWRSVPLTAIRDLDHGGRWVSLRAGTREWLWTNPSPAAQDDRDAVRPGDAFVDAGGGEECLPTVQGRPDHGELWTRRWQAVDGAEQVSTDDFRLTRRVASTALGIDADYTIASRRGRRFVHAVHLLLNTSASARLEVAGSPSTTWRDKDGPGRHEVGAWPVLSGVDFSRLGPDDGSAACLVLHGVRECRVVDGNDALRLSWGPTSPRGVPVGLVLWRNLAGWPDRSPYRSIGVEPLIGATVDDRDADACVRPAPDAPTSWRLHLEARTLLNA